MSASQSQIWLIHEATGQPIEAILFDEILDKHLRNSRQGGRHRERKNNMKYSISKEQILSDFYDDEGYEIAAGFSVLTPHQPGRETSDCGDRNVEESVDRCAFGSLIQLLRRAKKLTIGQLAELARVEASELLMIENDMHYLPRPHTVHQLAQFFDLPENKLVELSALKTANTSDLQHAALRFSMKAKPVVELSREEQSALNEFVKFLSS